MNLLKLEAEEPPSRPQATSQLLPKRHLPHQSSYARGHARSGAASGRVRFAPRALPRRASDPRVPQALLPRGRARPVERLALAGAHAHPHARRARAHLRAVGRTSATRSIRHQGSLPLGITPYYASLMAREDALGAAAPHPRAGRRRVSEDCRARPTIRSARTATASVPGLVHRYPDRVLFLATGFCSTYCRYCTRSRMVGEAGGDYRFSRPQWEDALATSPRIPRSATCSSRAATR